MKNLVEILKQYGKEKELSQDEVLIRQGAVSDGISQDGWGSTARNKTTFISSRSSHPGRRWARSGPAPDVLAWPR